MKTESHKIYRTSWQHNRVLGLRWYVQIYHHTGMSWDEDNCPKFRTREQAREHVRELRREAMEPRYEIDNRTGESVELEKP